MKIALTGDSILQRRLNSRDDETLRPLFDLLRGADVSFTNLEVLPNDFQGDAVLESGGSHFGARRGSSMNWWRAVSTCSPRPTTTASTTASPACMPPTPS